MMDDILISGKTQDEHDTPLKKVLKKLKAAGLTLNTNKCQFSVNCVTFLGQTVDSSGVQPGCDKVVAIEQIPEPQTVRDVRRFLGMMNQMSNQMSKFVPKPYLDITVFIAYSLASLLPLNTSSSRCLTSWMGMPGVLCMMDDILIFGKTQDEHDTPLKKVLKKLKAVGLTLNTNKCQFSVNCVTFLGQTVDSSGVQPGCDKVVAIEQFPEPQTVRDV